MEWTCDYHNQILFIPTHEHKSSPYIILRSASSAVQSNVEWRMKRRAFERSTGMRDMSPSVQRTDGWHHMVPFVVRIAMCLARTSDR